jgi:transposase
MWLELVNFPYYCPELNPTEQVIKISKDAVVKNSEKPFEEVKQDLWRYLTQTKFNVNFVEKYS